jgi:hypothetical protein
MTTPENPFQITGYQGSTYKPSTYTASQARASGYGAAQSNATTSQAQTAKGHTAAGVGSVKAGLRNINQATDTVAGQFDALTQKGSPLMTLARTNAAQQANSRGLLNSSMAIGAGEMAAYQAALPIAQQDASTYFQQGRDNQQHQNNANLYNHQAETQNRQFNAGQLNQTSQFNAQTGTQNNQFNAQLGTQNHQFNAQSTNQARQFGAEAGNKAALTNLAAQEAAGIDLHAVNVALDDPREARQVLERLRR